MARPVSDSWGKLPNENEQYCITDRNSDIAFHVGNRTRLPKGVGTGFNMAHWSLRQELFNMNQSHLEYFFVLMLRFPGVSVIEYLLI